MHCHKGDAVTARRQIDGMNVPLVPQGARGTVVDTTIFGRPKTVFFAVNDGWGLKRFHVEVHRGDVQRCGQDQPVNRPVGAQGSR
ncbi:MAG: hypothetical protein ABWY93_34120 [Mycobacterium sp.]